MTGPAERCGNCRWWTLNGAERSMMARDPQAQGNTGTCQSNSPWPLLTPSGQPVSLFPTTHASRFCGNWEPRDSTEGDGDTVIPFPRAAS